MKLPKGFPVNIASGIGIGAQTAMSMIKKAEIKNSQNVFVTSNTSLIILNFLRNKNYNIYSLSYSGKDTERVKALFPFITEIYNFKENNIPKDLLLMLF